MKNKPQPPSTPWLTAGQAAALPGLPNTERGIRSRAQRERWRTRQVRGRGGPGGMRLEFHLESLPQPARQAWLTGAPAQGLPANQPPSPTTPWEINPRVKARALARQRVVVAWERHLAKSDTTIREATRHFLDLLHQGILELPRHTRELLPRVSAATLYRWRNSLRNNGLPALGGRYWEASEAFLHRPEVSRFLHALVGDQPGAPDPRLIRTALGEQFAVTTPTLPSRRRLAQWLRRNCSSLN